MDVNTSIFFFRKGMMCGKDKKETGRNTDRFRGYQ